MRSVELIIIKQNNNECFKFEEKKSKKTERDERRYKSCKKVEILLKDGGKKRRI